MSRTSECPVVRQLRKFGLVMSSRVNFTSSAVKGLPSCQRTSSRNRIAPLQTVLRNAAVLLRRHLGREVRLDHAFGIDPEERVENREMHAVVDLDMHHQRIEDRRLLREPDDNPALGIRGAFWPKAGLVNRLGAKRPAAPPNAIIRNVSRRE